MKRFHCLLLLLCPYMTLSQNALTVGDKVPVALLQQLRSVEGKSLASLQNNKWLVLDFMASTCASCIKLLPAFSQLKRQYAAQLEIVLVSPQPKEKLQVFLQKNAALNFSMLAGDTVLNKYFPHETISHLVWINPGGIVKAITSGYYLTQKSFTQAISGMPLYWPVKQDGRSYDNNKALLTYHPANLQESFEEAPVYYDAVRAVLPDVSSQTSIVTDSINKVKRYSFINQSLPQMISKMLGKPTIPASYFVINSSLQQRFFYQLDTLLKDDWDLLNKHCIEMQLPIYSTKADAVKQFNNTLRQYFNIEARLDSINRNVWEIKGHPKQPMQTPEGYTLQSLGSIMTYLNKTAGAQPVVAATGTSIRQKIPMPLPGSMSIEEVLKLLGSYGYAVATVIHKMESIIISEN